MRIYGRKQLEALRWRPTCGSWLHDEGWMLYLSCISSQVCSCISSQVCFCISSQVCFCISFQVRHPLYFLQLTLMSRCTIASPLLQLHKNSQSQNKIGCTLIKNAKYQISLLLTCFTVHVDFIRVLGEGAKSKYETCIWGKPGYINAFPECCIHCLAEQ